MGHFHFETVLIFLSLILFPAFGVAVDFNFAGAAKSEVKEKKLCLNMIVKNESQIIERCLNNLKDHVDYICICDTGSTDKTVEILENYLKIHKIPGKICQHKWENFGHNRSLAFLEAQKMLKEMNAPLSDTYILLSDADMLLEFDPQFCKSTLNKDAYLVMQKSSLYAYYNLRLLRASLPWECRGVTHEYWACSLPNRQEKLETLFIDDRNDGGCKEDKFERDVRLLTKGLEKEPDNERYHFYLANCYKVLRQYENAIKYYKLRIGKDNFKEEVWYSKLMIGECYESQDEWNEALKWYLEAYEYHPVRAEPLHRIARYYRLKGDNHLAHVFAKYGTSIPYPQNQILFVEHPVYAYQFDEELSIASYYTPYREDGYEAASRLLVKKDVPESLRNQTYKNILYYLPELKNALYKPLVTKNEKEKGFCFSSMLKTKQGYQSFCKLIDIYNNCKNYLVSYDKHFNVVDQKEAIGLKESQANFRLVSNNEKTWLALSSIDNEKAKTSLLEIKSDSAETLHFSKNEIQNEKEGLPFIKDNKLCMVQSYDPEAFFGEKNTTDNSKYEFSRLKSFAPPTEFQGGYLVIVSETFPENASSHMERFLYLDKNFVPKKMSAPFTFRSKKAICLGVAVDHLDEKLVMTLENERKEGLVCLVDLKTINNILKDL